MQGASIFILNLCYNFITNYSTKKENHKYINEYEKSLIIK